MIGRPVREATPKAAPAVIRKIARALPEWLLMPNRPTPPVDPPAKRHKPAAEQIPYGQKAGKGKGSKGRPGGFNDENPGWYHEPRNRGFQHLPEPPPYIDSERREPRNGTREYLVRNNAVRDVMETVRIRRKREEEELNEAYNALNH